MVVAFVATVLVVAPVVTTAMVVGGWLVVVVGYPNKRPPRNPPLQGDSQL
jgi:hypothetical protein